MHIHIYIYIYMHVQWYTYVGINDTVAICPLYDIHMYLYKYTYKHTHRDTVLFLHDFLGNVHSQEGHVFSSSHVSGKGVIIEEKRRSSRRSLKRLSPSAQGRNWLELQNWHLPELRASAESCRAHGSRRSNDQHLQHWHAAIQGLADAESL